MYSFVKGFQASEFRNIKHYPIDETKVDEIINSMDKTGEMIDIEFRGKKYKYHTGYWDNNNGYVTDPGLQDELNAAKFLPMDKQLDLFVKLAKNKETYLANGHHRQAALIKRGVDIIDIPIRYMTKPVRLSVMVAENLESFGGTAFTTLESISQTAKFTMDGVEGTTNFTEYKTKLGEDIVFKSAKQYSAAVKAGAPSVRVMTEFFGKNGMDKNTINAGLTAMKYIREGVYDKLLIQKFPSTDNLRTFNSLTLHLMESEIPAGIKDFLVRDCAEYVLQYKPSGREITAAGTQVKAGKDPLAMLKAGMLTPFDLTRYLIKLIRQDVSLRTLDGMDSDTAKSSLADAEKYIEAQALKEARAARREVLEKAGKTPEEIMDTLVAEKLMTRPPAPVEIPEDATPEERAELEAKAAESDPSPAEDGLSDTGMGIDSDGEGVVNAPDRDSVQSVMNYAHSSMMTTGRQLTNLIGRVDEAKDAIETAGMVDTFWPAVEKLHKVCTYLMLEHVGIDKIRKGVTVAAKIPATEAGLDIITPKTEAA